MTVQIPKLNWGKRYIYIQPLVESGLRKSHTAEEDGISAIDKD